MASTLLLSSATGGISAPSACPKMCAAAEKAVHSSCDRSASGTSVSR